MQGISSYSISTIRPLNLKWNLGLRIFWILSLISLASLLVFYIFQVNKIVFGEYLLQGCEQKLNEIIEESKRLEIDFSQVNSLENIETLAKNLEFEKAEKIHYIQVLQGKVVSK